MTKGFVTSSCPIHIWGNRWSWWLQQYSTGENKVKLPEQCQKAFLHPDGPGGCSTTVILLFGLTASPFRIVNLLMWKRLTICVEKVRGMAIGSSEPR